MADQKLDGVENPHQRAELEKEMLGRLLGEAERGGMTQAEFFEFCGKFMAEEGDDPAPGFWARLGRVLQERTKGTDFVLLLDLRDQVEECGRRLAPENPGADGCERFACGLSRTIARYESPDDEDAVIVEGVGYSDETLRRMQDEALEEVAAAAQFHANRLPSRAEKRSLLIKIANLQLGLPERLEASEEDAAAVEREGRRALAMVGRRFAVRLPMNSEWRELFVKVAELDNVERVAEFDERTAANEGGE